MPSRSSLPSWRTRWPAIALGTLWVCAIPAWNGMPLAYPDTPTYLRGAAQGAARLLGEGARTAWDSAATAGHGMMSATPPEGSSDAGEATLRPMVGGETESGQVRQAADAGGVSRAPRLTSLEGQIVLAGRSVYYGALLWASQWIGSLWLAVLVQAGCVAWLLHLVMVDLGRASHPVYWGSVAALSLATPLSVFAGLLMPDVWVALAIAAAAVMAVYWRALRRGQQWALAGMLLFGLAGHASAVPVVAGIGMLAWGLRRWRAGWEGVSGRGLGIATLCVAAALMAEAAFGLAVTRLVGMPPLRLPHLTARLVEAGPGATYLRGHCPQAGWAACAYVDHLPTAWTDFLFSGDPRRGAFALADAADKRRLSQEQLTLARAIAREDPWGVAQVLASDAVRQVLTFRVDVWGFGERELAMYAGRVPAAWLLQMERSRGRREPRWNTVMTWLTWASVAMAFAWLVGLWLRQRSVLGHRRALATDDRHAGRPGGGASGLGSGLHWPWASRNGRDETGPLPHRLEQLMWLVLAGVIANALVCGLLASPLDRFQARVVWLVPWVALLAAHARWVQVQRGTATRWHASLPSRPGAADTQGVAAGRAMP